MRSYCPDLESVRRKTLIILVCSGLNLFGLFALPGVVPQDCFGCYEALAQTGTKAPSSGTSAKSGKSSHHHKTAGAGKTSSAGKPSDAGKTASGASSRTESAGRSASGRRSRGSATTSRSRHGVSPPAETNSRNSRRHRGRRSDARRKGGLTDAKHSHHPTKADEKAKQAAEQDDNEASAQAAAEAPPRLRNYSLLGSAYALYDQGVNERLKGNYGLSTDKLTEAIKLVDQASSIARDGQASTLSSMLFFELGQSAEADGDLGLARDSYVHAVKAKASYVEAYLRLVNVLATSGKLAQALNYLKDGLRESPHDARLNAMLVQLGGYMGDGRNSGFGTDMSEKSEDVPEASARTGKADKKSADEAPKLELDEPPVEKSQKAQVDEPPVEKGPKAQMDEAPAEKASKAPVDDPAIEKGPKLPVDESETKLRWD